MEPWPHTLGHVGRPTSGGGACVYTLKPCSVVPLGIQPHETCVKSFTETIRWRGLNEDEGNWGDVAFHLNLIQKSRIPRRAPLAAEGIRGQSWKQ